MSQRQSTIVIQDINILHLKEKSFVIITYSDSPLKYPGYFIFKVKWNYCAVISVIYFTKRFHHSYLIRMVENNLKTQAIDFNQNSVISTTAS